MTLYNDPRRYRYGVRFAPGQGFGRRVRVRSAKEIEASRLTNAQMAAIWNALPGTAPVAKFKDRNSSR